MVLATKVQERSRFQGNVHRCCLVVYVKTAEWRKCFEQTSVTSDDWWRRSNQRGKKDIWCCHKNIANKLTIMKIRILNIHLGQVLWYGGWSCYLEYLQPILGWVPVWVPAPLLLVRLPAGASGRQQMMVRMVGFLSSMWEALIECLVPGFSLAQPGCLGHLGSEPVDGKFLLALSCSCLSVSLSVTLAFK